MPHDTPAVYTYSARLKRFYLALSSTVATLLFIIIWPSAGADNVSHIAGIIPPPPTLKKTNRYMNCLLKAAGY